MDGPKEMVRVAAEKEFGSEFPEEFEGELWRWCMHKGVHAYLKRKYYDLKLVTGKSDPWIILATGDGARVSQRNATVTICGLKVCDLRHPDMQGTGKTTNQSPTTYTPSICALRGESDCVASFISMVLELEKIEKQGFITVNGKDLPLHIKVGIIGDKSFMWKMTGRGHACGSGQFCWLCKASANMRHKGQPGGCKKCRERGTVYGLNDVQKCPHHDIISEEELQRAADRLDVLRAEIKPKIPLTARPVWKNVDELRELCLERSDSEVEREEICKLREMELEKMLLRKTCIGCELGDSPSNGVRKCDLSLVKEELHVRDMSTIGTSRELRAKLTARLQLEQEYFGLEAATRDERFNVEDWGVLQDPSRHLLDLLHLPMRTNEKMVHMLKMKALERRGGKTKEGKTVLEELDNVLRDLGQLGDKWVSAVPALVWSHAIILPHAPSSYY